MGQISSNLQECLGKLVCDAWSLILSQLFLLYKKWNWYISFVHYKTRTLQGDKTDSCKRARNQTEKHLVCCWQTCWVNEAKKLIFYWGKIWGELLLLTRQVQGECTNFLSDEIPRGMSIFMILIPDTAKQSLCWAHAGIWMGKPTHISVKTGV